MEKNSNVRYYLISIVDGEKHRTECTESEAHYYMSDRGLSVDIKCSFTGFKGKKVFTVPFDRNLVYEKVEVVYS